MCYIKVLIKNSQCNNSPECITHWVGSGVTSIKLFKPINFFLLVYLLITFLKKN